MGSRHRMLAIFGVVQNYHDMIKPICENDAELLIVAKLQEAVHKAFDTWGFQMKKNDLKKIHDLYQSFHDDALIKNGVEWGPYTAFTIGILSDLMAYITDPTRRAVLINIVDILQKIYDIIDGDEGKSTETMNKFGELLDEI